MNDNKHIDRLYQEKFKDFEVAPNPKIWNTIEASLQKKKRRVLPFWWLSGGAVATLLIGLFLFPFSSDEKPIQIKNNSVIITKSNTKLEEKTVEQPKKTLPKSVKKHKKNHFTQERIAKQEKQKVNKNIQKKSTVFSSSNAIAEKITTKKTNSKNSNEKDVNNKELPKKQKTEENKSIKKELLKKSLLAEVTNKKEENKTKNVKKWSVTPTFAVLTSNSFSNNSAIDASLNNNTVSGKNTYSYGVKIAYQFTKKWAIQSGIHLQEMQFNTADVPAHSGVILATSLENISSLNEQPLSLDTNGGTDFNSGLGKNFNVNINQSIGYIEFPVELSYTFINSKKLNTRVLTGFSTLFLNKNEITAATKNSSQVIGEANNLNTVNFSGNVGLDVNYQLSKKFIFNVNPMFKTQLHTFSKNANGFKPYTIGIYTGIRYNF